MGLSSFCYLHFLLAFVFGPSSVFIRPVRNERSCTVVHLTLLVFSGFCLFCFSFIQLSNLLELFSFYSLQAILPAEEMQESGFAYDEEQEELSTRRKEDEAEEFVQQ